MPTHMEVLIDYMDGEFSGVIYTEGSYADPNCLRQISSTRKMLFKVPYDGCKTTRVRA